MPCTKCEEEGNYKWGKTGECKYDTLESCESANSKYNKMRPTPLGKKSYEEYAKELKEFNLSKVERVELGLDDYAKFIKEVKSIGDKIEKQADGIIDRIEKLSKDARATVKDGYKEIADVGGTVNKLHAKMLKAVKDLGIDGKPFFTEYNKFEDAKNKSRQKLKDLEAYLKRQL